MSKCDVCGGRWPCKLGKKLTERKMLHIYASRIQGMNIMELADAYGLPPWRVDEVLEHVKAGFSGA